MKTLAREDMAEDENWMRRERACVLAAWQMNLSVDELTSNSRHMLTCRSDELYASDSDCQTDTKLVRLPTSKSTRD